MTGLVLAAQLALATTAPAAGGPPIPGFADGAEGVTAPGNDDRYIVLPARGDTLVARVEPDVGRVANFRSFANRLEIPAVAIDGSAGGLSADGDTLVLRRTPAWFGQRHTTFELVDAMRLRSRGRITLDGSFTFDAISPDGSRIYLVEYLSPTDPTRYEVRAYDTRSGRLLRDPIVDPNEPPGEMRGYPITRAMSPAGRWAYTLYDGGGDHPFIHALDTLGGRAVCIDVHPLAGHPGLRNVFAGNADRFGLAVSGDGGELTVLDRDVPVAYVDTQSFEVSEPTAPPGGGEFPWVLVSLAAAAFVAGALTLVLRRRRHDVAADGAREGPPQPTGS
jgi:hypothetical protein